MTLGIEIQSSEEITVYAVNKHTTTSDAFVVFPVDLLGYAYYAILKRSKLLEVRVQTIQEPFIWSSKVVSVIRGNQYSRIGAGFADHLSSQMTQIDTFGKRFVTINMQNCDVPVNFKIVASANNTNINIYGKGTVHLLIAGDLYSFQIVVKSSRTIVADKPVAVVFFAEGGFGSDNGDPAMISLPPLEQFAADYTFSTINNPDNHSVGGGLQ
ncbi:uncharacterized protein LOC127721165 [Mytilus californianus]|uniref:uncharacterized protein LOC127721165 n=1 Tax=Mytilus californianus TaxID=6549 RepID=UPI0022474202|nr:uncharacterized protein LOC127721165 [Mytilus californianus]